MLRTTRRILPASAPTPVPISRECRKCRPQFRGGCGGLDRCRMSGSDKVGHGIPRPRWISSAALSHHSRWLVIGPGRRLARWVCMGISSAVGAETTERRSAQQDNHKEMGSSESTAGVAGTGTARPVISIGSSDSAVFRRTTCDTTAPTSMGTGPAGRTVQLVTSRLPLFYRRAARQDLGNSGTEVETRPPGPFAKAGQRTWAACERTAAVTDRYLRRNCPDSA